MGPNDAHGLPALAELLRDKTPDPPYVAGEPVERPSEDDLDDSGDWYAPHARRKRKKRKK